MMTKGRVALPLKFVPADDEQQVPPLRFAPVGMTLLLGGRGLVSEYLGAPRIPRD
jgi:hypothetical protein